MLYLSTRRAFETLTQRIHDLWTGDLPSCTVVPLYLLEHDAMVTSTRDPRFDRLLESYYDESIMDRHLAKGGEDVKHGYAGGSLAVGPSTQYAE